MTASRLRLNPLSAMLLLAAMATSGGCSATRSIDLSQLAATGGATGQLVRGQGFRHRLFTNEPAASRADGAPVLVFLEGDGTPWTHGGRRPAEDPGPHQPLAFHLFLQTPLPAWYITRPCYSGTRDADCEPRFWTSARYSPAVVDSLASAIADRHAAEGRPQLILVGYSGGGVLAVLVAARLGARGVITIASNLDTGAWVERHRYLPLADSLNPATQPRSGVPHVLLTGSRDRNVPLSSVAGYLQRNPGTVVMPRDGFDHRCCWTEQWPQILAEALARLPGYGAEAAAFTGP